MLTMTRFLSTKSINKVVMQTVGPCFTIYNNKHKHNDNNNK